VFFLEKGYDAAARAAAARSLEERAVLTLEAETWCWMAAIALQTVPGC
jgi:hypothetical protein